MPAYEPGGKIRIILDGDESKDTKPTFICKALSRRESIALMERLQGLSGSMLEQFRELDKVFSETLLGWENMPVPFSHDALADVLGTMETWRLAWAIARQQGDYEKKA
jgi:hypothetical protein